MEPQLPQPCSYRISRLLTNLNAALACMFMQEVSSATEADCRGKDSD